MGQATLVDSQISGGKALLDALRAAGFDVTVSGWTQPSEENDWELYIASDDVDSRGITAAYRTVYLVIQANPELGIDPFDVKLIGPHHPIATDLLAIRGVARLPTRTRRPRLGNVGVDDTYVYAA